MAKLRIVPLTLRQANALIKDHHRHHKPVVGCRFAIGVQKENQIVAAAVVGRPVARMTDQYAIAEVTRLVSDGTPHTCSMLYAACARICKEMGFTKIQTFILDSEPGISLRAAGWQYEGSSGGGTWNRTNRNGRREDQPLVPKQRWSRQFTSTEGHEVRSTGGVGAAGAHTPELQV